MKATMQKLHSVITSNILVRIGYKVKFYIDVAVGNISWISGKMPEIMAVVFLGERFGIVFTREGIVGFIISILFILFVVGYFLKKSGLYDTEQYVNAEKNPVQYELLQPARIVKKWDQERSKK